MSQDPTIRASILKSVCDKLDSRDFTVFYNDIIDRINAAFAYCDQFGVGPKGGFEITSENDVWADYGAKSITELNLVKAFVSAKVKMEFDPPTTGPLLNALKETVQECEWRITNNR